MKKQILTACFLLFNIAFCFSQQAAIHANYGYQTIFKSSEGSDVLSIYFDIPVNNFLCVTPFISKFEKTVPGNSASQLTHEPEPPTIEHNSWLIPYSNRSYGLGPTFFKTIRKHQYSIMPFISYDFYKYQSLFVRYDQEGKLLPSSYHNKNGVTAFDMAKYSFNYGLQASYKRRIFPQWYVGLNYSRSYSIESSEFHQYSITASISLIIPPKKKQKETDN